MLRLPYYGACLALWLLGFAIVGEFDARAAAAAGAAAVLFGFGGAVIDSAWTGVLIFAGLASAFLCPLLLG